jgi:C-terminal processing protease CtpA/Prc
MRILVIIALFFTLCSCENLLFEPDMASKDVYENFDYLWNEVDRKYSYFELKQVDWNEIRTRYRTMLHGNMTEDSLFNVLKAMLLELRDDHTNLVSPFNIAIYNVELQGEPNFFSRTILEYYLQNDIYYTGSFIHGFLHNRQIGYIRYSSFMNSVSKADLDFVLTRYAYTDGLILDLRKNGGGSVFIVPKILARFVEQKVTACYFKTRNGPKHTDFGPNEPFTITPHNGIRYQKPVMVLIDRGSYSATTLFAQATKALPNMILVGDTTGGGGGLPNGGQLPNGWTYRFSVGQTIDLQGNIHSEEGVPADIPAQFNWNDLTRDEIIERAISEIVNMQNK